MNIPEVPVMQAWGLKLLILQRKN